MTVLQKQLTPGQQTSIEIDIEYRDGVDIYFEPSQFDWQPFTLIEHKKSLPYLLTSENSKTALAWKVTYNIELIAPISGIYNFENMLIQSYLGNQHSSQLIVSPEIEVSSSFDSTDNMNDFNTSAKPSIKPRLQGLEPFHQLEEVNSDKPVLVALALALMAIGITFIAFRMQQKIVAQKDHKTLISSNLTSPQILIDNANNDDNYDWKMLQQCIQDHLGFDPLSVEIKVQNLALSKEFTSARFSNNNKQKYIELCELCLNIKNKDVRDTNNA